MLKRSLFILFVVGILFASSFAHQDLRDDSRNRGNDGPNDHDDDDDDDGRSQTLCTFNCNCISDADQAQILRSLKEYWLSQVWPRTKSRDDFVISSFNPKVTSAPFYYKISFDGEDQVVAGWRSVSTYRKDANGVVVGAYFENNTKVEIKEASIGCSTDGKVTGSIAVNRTFYYNETGETFWTTYFSIFHFIKTSLADIAKGKQRYTIIDYEYQPFVLPMSRHWPGTPLSPSPTDMFWACKELSHRCGYGIDWSPYPTCYQWLKNHPYTEQYDPTFVQGTGYCIYQIAFFGSTRVPSSDPNINLCPYVPLCTGNFGASQRREIPKDILFQAMMA